MKAKHTAQVILPTGQVIELIYVSEPEERQVGAAPVVADEPVIEERPRLNHCPECAGELVYPVWWEELDEHSWTVERRCPSCEWRQVGEFPQELVDEFDDALTEGTEAMLSGLREMVQSNMAEDVERLVAALETGLIQPIDF